MSNALQTAAAAAHTAAATSHTACAANLNDTTQAAAYNASNSAFIASYVAPANPSDYFAFQKVDLAWLAPTAAAHTTAATFHTTAASAHTALAG